MSLPSFSPLVRVLRRPHSHPSITLLARTCAAPWCRPSSSSTASAPAASSPSAHAPPPAPAASAGPLVGIRVLDLSRILAGPYCTMLLGDYGAEVIKVEMPGSGDDTRSWGPPFVPLTGAHKGQRSSTYFLSVNRNKKSITVNLKNAAGAALVKELAMQSDVLVENFIAGTLDKYGLDYASLHAINPRLVYCSLTGYGSTGPDRARAGYDVMVSAVGGLMSITGPADGPPVKVGVPVTDISTGLYAHGAIMAALVARGRTGQGQHIDCSLLETQVAMLSSIASAYLNAGRLPSRTGTAHESIVPYQLFSTSDGALVVGALNDRQFVELCDNVLLKPTLRKDPHFATNPARVEHRHTLISTLEAEFKSQPSALWLERLQHTSLPYGPVNNLKQVFEDPQVLAREMVLNIPYPVAGGGHIRTPGFAVKLSETPCSLHQPPPLLGEHTDDVLASVLGFTAEKISQVRSSGALG